MRPYEKLWIVFGEHNCVLVTSENWFIIEGLLFEVAIASSIARRVWHRSDLHVHRDVTHSHRVKVSLLFGPWHTTLSCLLCVLRPQVIPSIKGPDGGCDRLTYWLTDWLRLQTIRFAWLKPCVSNHCKCGTWCLLNYFKRLSWRSQKNLKIIESDLTLDRIGHLV